MSLHSYSRCWIHFTWATLRRERVPPKPAAVKVSGFLNDYARDKGIYMVINYVNPEHVHTLVDLPTAYSIEQLVKLLKGASSHWINQNRIIPGKFRWGRGYLAFSVSLKRRRGFLVHRRPRGASPQTRFHRRVCKTDEGP